VSNWCSNILTITSHLDEEKLDEWDMWLCGYENDYTEGHVPECVEKPEGWLFDLGSVDGGNCQFNSKWAPPIKSMIQIADHYGFAFKLEYEEGGSGLYGEYTYDPLTKVLLQRDVPDELKPDDESAGYYDALDALLEKEEFTNIKLI
jgi:hypothetical protein